MFDTSRPSGKLMPCNRTSVLTACDSHSASKKVSMLDYGSPSKSLSPFKKSGGSSVFARAARPQIEEDVLDRAAISAAKAQVSDPFKNEFNPKNQTGSPPKRMTFHGAKPEAKENLQKRMSFIPDVKKRGQNTTSESAEDFLSNYMQRKKIRDQIED